VCLDPTISVDPLFLTPEMDTEFSLAKLQANPSACSAAIASVPAAGGSSETPDFEMSVTEPTITPCGEHEPIREQKEKHEIPFYVVLDPEMEAQVDVLVVRYAFDASSDYKQIEFEKRDIGYGALLTCDEGQIRIFDPATVSYYIEGTNAIGEVICGHGTKEVPNEILMMPDAVPLPPIGGMTPKECAPCPPWDKTCGRMTLPGLGDPCRPDKGCQEGLKCADFGICEMEEKPAGSQGPSTFYVNIYGGTGFAYFNKDWSIKTVNEDGQITEAPQGSGTAWAGIPARLAVGYFVIPKLSVEISGRFDIYVASINEPQSCWDAGGKTEEGMDSITCYPQPTTEEEGKTSVAYTDDPNEGGQEIWIKEYQYAWIINARARYKLLSQGAFVLSAFGGLGYGHIQYRIAGEGTAYFPMVGMVDIELGPGISYFFTDHFGFNLEVPIDILVGDGFALNFDLALGLGFGF
jgi:hypothetical protein